MTVNEVTRDVWDISDIEQEAQHWTLSSDVNMLQFLQTFSENLTSKLNSTSESLEQLICFTEEVSTKLNNTFNDFNMLSNVQFIESRVYEDDETKVADDMQQLPEIQEEETPEVIGARIKTSIEYGLTVLDAGYTVRPIDENDDESELVIQAKDPYSSRHLPFLIGSSEYCLDETAGVNLLYQSDEESNKSEDEEESSEEEDDEKEEDESIKELSGDETIDSLSTLNTSQQGEVVASTLPPNSRTASIFDKPQTTRDKVFDSIFDSSDESEEEVNETPPAVSSTVKQQSPSVKSRSSSVTSRSPSVKSRSPSITSRSPSVTSDSKDTRSGSVSSVRSHKHPKGVPKGAVSIFGGRTVFEGGSIKVIQSESEEEEDKLEKEVESPPKKLPPPRASRGIFSSSEESDEEEINAPPPKKKETLQKKKAASRSDSPSSTDPNPLAKGNKRTPSFDSIFGPDSDEDSDSMFAPPVDIRNESQPAASTVIKSAPKGGLFSESEYESLSFEEPKNKKLVTKKEEPHKPSPDKKVETKNMDSLFDTSDEDGSAGLFGPTRKSIDKEGVRNEKNPPITDTQKHMKTNKEIPKNKSDDIFASDSEDDLFPSASKTQNILPPNAAADLQKNIASSLMREAMSKSSKKGPLSEEPDEIVSKAKSSTNMHAKTVVEKSPPTKREKGLFDSSDEDESDDEKTAPDSVKNPTGTGPTNSSSVAVISQQKNKASNLVEEAMSKSYKPASESEQNDVISTNASTEKTEEKITPIKSNKSLFDSSNEDESDDDMFATIKANSSPVSKTEHKDIEPAGETKTNSKTKNSELFDQNDSDSDDMFSPSKQNPVPTRNDVSAIRRQSQLSDLFMDSDEESGDFLSKPLNSSPPKFDIVEENEDKIPSSTLQSDQKSPTAPLKQSLVFSSDTNPISVDINDNLVSSEKDESSIPKAKVTPSTTKENIDDDLKPGPPSMEEDHMISKQRKLEVRAAKFDDLFAESEDDEDMFSTTNKDKSQHFHENLDFIKANNEDTITGASSNTLGSHDVYVDLLEETPSAPVVPVDLESSDLHDSDSHEKEITRKQIPKSENSPTASESGEEVPKEVSTPVVVGADLLADVTVKSPLSQVKKASRDSKVAKLGNNLNFNPAMLLGGPRPIKKMNDRGGDIPTPTIVPESAGGVISSEETPSKSTTLGDVSGDVLATVTKGRAKRGGRRPPSRGVKSPSQQPTTASTSHISTPSSSTQPPTTASTSHISTPSSSTQPPTTVSTSYISTPASTTASVNISPKEPTISSEQSAQAYTSSSDPPSVSNTSKSENLSSNQPPDTSTAHSFQVKASITKSKKSSIFEDSLFGEEDIFAEKPKKVNRDALFDDIFESSPPKDTSKASVFDESPQRPSKKPTTTTKKTDQDDIFKDLGGDDDLFADFGSKPTGKQKVQKSSKPVIMSPEEQPHASSTTEKTNKTKVKTPKQDVDIFADDFDLFADVTFAKPKKEKKNSKKAAPKKSVDFDDPLFG